MPNLSRHKYNIIGHRVYRVKGRHQHFEIVFRDEDKTVMREAMRLSMWIIMRVIRVIVLVMTRVTTRT